jgi:hypothetical protein
MTEEEELQNARIASQLTHQLVKASHEWIVERMTKRLWSRNLPEWSILYHYTSAAGLHGILNSQLLHASSIQFMNDANELRYAADLVTRVLTEMKDSLEDKSNSVLYEQLLHTFNLLGGFQICAVAFSEDRDDLSQWRGYGGGTGGFALGSEPNQGLARAL